MNLHFVFYANNSGGGKADKPVIVIVPASDDAHDIANWAAESRAGINFNDVPCECCGPNWRIVRRGDGEAEMPVGVRDARIVSVNETQAATLRRLNA